MQISDIQKIKAWFLSQSRDLPWRDRPTPYAVWISEVMLQQTQVSVVIPYFEQWMQHFPSIQALALAPIEEVLKAWEGLGYYSRARNLHEGARYVVDNFNGILPASPEGLSQIKGIGSYTIGAILSFAFHQRMAAVDGNVLRVLARYYALPDDISKGKTVKKVQNLAAALLPEEEPWIISEALIELGATICCRQPKCSQCPLNGNCMAYLQDKTQQLPVKSAGSAITPLYRAVAIISHDGHLLVGRGTKGKVMADLCEFPYIDVHPSVAEHQHVIKQHMQQHGGLALSWQHNLPAVKHTFTRYRALLYPCLFHAKHPQTVPDYEWMSYAELKKLPFSAGHRRILVQLGL